MCCSEMRERERFAKCGGHTLTSKVYMVEEVQLWRRQRWGIATNGKKKQRISVFYFCFILKRMF